MRALLALVALIVLLGVAAASVFEVTKTCTTREGGGGIYTRNQESSSCSWRVERR